MASGDGRRRRTDGRAAFVTTPDILVVGDSDTIVHILNVEEENVVNLKINIEVDSVGSEIFTSDSDGIIRISNPSEKKIIISAV